MEKLLFPFPIDFLFCFLTALWSLMQTYERSCIEKWIGIGHNTCPKTQQSLHNAFLSPNYVLRSLIAEWCEANGVELPKRPGTSNPRKTAFPFDTGVEPNRSSYLLYPAQEQAPSFPLRTYERQGGHTERQGGHAGASSSPQPLPSTFESHVLASLRSLTLNMGHLSSQMTAMQDAHNRTFEQQTRRLEQITRMYEDLRMAIHPLYDFVYRQGMISPSAQHPSWYSPPSLTQSHFGFHGPFFQGRDQGRGYGQDSGEAIRRADSSFGSPTGRDNEDNNDGSDSG